MVAQRGTSTRYIEHLANNIGKALEAGGMLVEQTAQIYAPLYTGNMMRSVGHTPPRLINGKLGVLIGPGPEAPYAKYTELDDYLSYLYMDFAVPKQLGPKSVAKGTARMPWLRPALKDNKGEIVSLIVKAVRSTKP